MALVEIETILGTLRESALELLKEEGQSAAEKTQAGMALIALELLGCFLVDVRRIADQIERVADLIDEGLIYAPAKYASEEDKMTERANKGEL